MSTGTHSYGSEPGGQARSLPLASCIMPTRNRRRFVPLALAYFARQDYEPRELIVLDDGDDPVAELMPDDPRVRYVRLDRRQTVGAKRNMGCRLAKGDVIVHWDDDDWMADWRLTYQVAQLREKDADLCGLDRLLFLDARRGQAWQYVYPRAAKSNPRSGQLAREEQSRGAKWLAGGTFCYRRELWQRNPFPELDVGEDNRFVWSREAKRLLALPDNSFYVAMIHDGNTSPKRTSGSRWQAHPVEPLRKMLGKDWARYAGEIGDGVEMRERKEKKERRENRQVRVTSETGTGRAGHATRSLITDHRSPATDPSQAVTVSLPYYDCRRYLLRAVDSILNQTHTNLTLVVVNDGDRRAPWDLLAHIDDPRLVRYDLGVNRGRYFVDAVILAATPDPYLLIQDADDWSEPARIALLLERWQLSKSCHLCGAISSSRLWREGSRAGRVLTYPGLRRPLSDRFEFRSDHHGLFSTEALRQVGGNYGGFRIGYDTLLVNLLGMVGEVAHVERPLYNRQVRANSLTTSQSTGMRSAKRRQVRNELATIYAAALKRYRARQRDDDSGVALAAAIRELTQSRVSDRERAEIASHAARLRELILASQMQRSATGVLAGEPDHPGDAGRQLEAQLRQLLHDPRLGWNSWTVTPAMAQRLITALCQGRPQRILEAGSGLSTALLARYAELTGAEVVTLEHEPRYFRQTAALLDQLGLRRSLDLRLASLGAVRRNGYGPKQWYRPLPDGEFDFVFVDGPPKRIGREGTLFALHDHVAGGGELWLHDGHRQHEKECLAVWQREFSFEASLVDADKGAWILRNITALAQDYGGRER